MLRPVVVALTALLFLGALPSPAAAKKLSLGETIDVNTAGYDDWLRVPGVGKTRARAILEYRENHGPFASVDDLDKVKGIGRKSLKKLRPWLRIGGKPASAVTTPPPETRAPEPSPPPVPTPAAPKDVTTPKDEGRGATDVEVL